MAEPRFPFVALEVAASHAEELGYELMELGSSGVELKEEGGVVRLVATFATLEAAEAARAALHGSLNAEVGELVGDAWREAYKEHFKPFKLTRTLVVVPSWETYVRKEGEIVMHMDPGRAFGTGLHATTSLVCEALDARRDEVKGVAVLDVGTGSGILAIAAVLLGARSGLAIDNDPEVLDIARENVARNGVAVRVEGTDLDDVAGTFGAVVANIRADTLIAMAPALHVRTERLLVVSGVLASEEAEVAAAFVKAGMTREVTLRRDEGADAWIAMVWRP